jgi:hypothetical protein
MDLFPETLSEQINLIGEGSHSLLKKKAEWPIFETHKIRPSATIIRGQNTSAISQITWEIWNCDCECDWNCECECWFPMKIENVNGHDPFQKNIQKALTISLN